MSTSPAATPPRQTSLARAVLVVEDDGDHAELVRLAVDRSSGWAVRRVVGTLADARTALAEDDFDAVIVDMMLPDGDGLDLVREAKEAAPDRPVLVLTSLSEKNLGDEAIRRGAAEFLEKAHLSPDRVERALRHALERARLDHLRRVEAQRVQQLTADLEAIRGAVTAVLGGMGGDDPTKRRLEDVLHRVDRAMDLARGR